MVASSKARDDRRGDYLHGSLWILLGLVALAFGIECVAILVATDGHFTYSLDDPYIHLALAKQISHGHYGINPGEASSPSSSILWPFLLATLAWLPAFDWVPLALNLVATVGTAAVLWATFRRLLTGPWATAASAAAVVGLNLIGVAFTGMEHSFQALLAVAVGHGAVLTCCDRRMPGWLPVVMVLGPLVRYENAALSVAAAVVLASSRLWRPAILTTIGWVTGVATFSVFLRYLGLDPLPSSILAKSVYTHQPLGAAVTSRAIDAFSHPSFVLAVAVVMIDARLMRRWSLLHWFATMILTAHLLARDFGWRGRYEIYVLAAVLPVLASFVDDWVFTRERTRMLMSAVVMLLAPAALASLAMVTFRTPNAASDVWSQQAQTAAFVKHDWRRPIAVNDLGLVAYRGGQPVLDLWGLASQDARKARLAANGTQWMQRIVDRSDVRLVAIYTDWFGEVPRSWTLVGHLSRPAQVSEEATVDIYAVRPDDVGAICTALTEFATQKTSPQTDVTCD